MSDIAIRAEGLSKRYRLGEHSGYGSIREDLSTAFRRLFSLGERRKDPRNLWALEDVSFELRQGEALGIIGRNGAGKSTLLKLLSRITEPTRGRAEIRGRVGSLLEVGTGFHPELTGRENIFLNGTILGMRRNEIARKFDEIVEFAEVARFVDTPVKRYSSGMYLRLAFSVAAHLEPEILLVDEVLAVGDVAFQKKCLGRMNEFAQQGRTVVFVSHTLAMIKQLCHQCIRLESGRLVDSGDSQRVVDDYVKVLYGSGEGRDIEEQIAQLSEDAAFRLRSLRVVQDGEPAFTLSNGKAIRLEIEYDLLQDLEGFHVLFRLAKTDGVVLFESMHDGQLGRTMNQSAGRYVSTATIPANVLNESTYVLTLNAGIHNIRPCLTPPISVTLDVFRDGLVNSTYPAYVSPGVMLLDIDWRTTNLLEGSDWPVSTATVP